MVSGMDGGGERDRTDDLLLAKQALSQLSYTPSFALRASEGEPRHAAGGAMRSREAAKHGGSGWNRTNDPRLIKTVL